MDGDDLAGAADGVLTQLLTLFCSLHGSLSLELQPLISEGAKSYTIIVYDPVCRGTPKPSTPAADESGTSCSNP
ncbi:hypothetical protein GCM10027449_28000 [Sinomonas notoginsengisoli]